MRRMEVIKRIVEILKAARNGQLPIEADLLWIKSQLEEWHFLTDEIAIELDVTFNQLQDEINRYAMHMKVAGLA